MARLKDIGDMQIIEIPLSEIAEELAKYLKAYKAGILLQLSAEEEEHILGRSEYRNVGFIVAFAVGHALRKEGTRYNDLQYQYDCPKRTLLMVMV